MTIGMLMLSGGLFGAVAGSAWTRPYNAHLAVLRPDGRGHGADDAGGVVHRDGAVDQTQAGVASGVINASRQVGGASGIAVLGASVRRLPTNSWDDEVAALPAGGAGARGRA